MEPYHAAFRYYPSREMICDIINHAAQDIATAATNYIDMQGTVQGGHVVRQVDCKQRSMEGKRETSQ